MREVRITIIYNYIIDGKKEIPMANIQLLLRQHVGAPCAPVVKVGDEVKKGTLVAEPTGLGANIFSSVYGKVVEITEDRIIIEPAAEQPAEYVKIAKSEQGSGY